VKKTPVDVRAKKIPERVEQRRLAKGQIKKTPVLPSWRTPHDINLIIVYHVEQHGYDPHKNMRSILMGKACG
jgi:hypothetical protein